MARSPLGNVMRKGASPPLRQIFSLEEYPISAATPTPYRWPSSCETKSVWLRALHTDVSFFGKSIGTGSQEKQCPGGKWVLEHLEEAAVLLSSPLDEHFCVLAS
eukprot:PhM_4_TR4194/c0_g1_i1/m.60056